MIDLREIRRESGRMAKDVALDMGLSAKNGRQSIAQLETRPDWHLSTLRKYLDATGATAEIVVTVNGKQFVYDL